MAPAFAEKGVESGVLQKIEALKPSKKNWSKDGDALKKMLADYLSVAIKDIKARLGKMTDIADGHDNAIVTKGKEMEKLRKELSTIRADIKKEIPAASGSVLDAHPFQKIEINLERMAFYDEELPSINAFMKTGGKLHTSEDQSYHDRKSASDKKLSKYHRREDISSLQKSIRQLKADAEENVAKLKELKEAKRVNSKLQKIALEALESSKKDRESAKHAIHALEGLLKVLKDEKTQVDEGKVTASTYKSPFLHLYADAKKTHGLNSSPEFRDDFQVFIEAQIKRIEATIKALDNIVAAENKSHLLKGKSIKEYAI